MKKLFLSLAMALAGILPAASQEFFSTDEPAQLFNLGVRVGLNTSNRTITGMTASVWNHNSWGVGFDAGFVADINLKNFISLQPGFFYETRSGAFAYQNTLYAGEVHTTKTQVGKGREYLFTVPIVA